MNPTDNPFEKPSTEQATTNYFIGDGWEQCSPASLRGHIVTQHLDPNMLSLNGIPLYDIDVAADRGIGLGWVVKKAVEKLAQTDAAIEEQIPNRARAADRINPTSYRVLVAKTIKVINDRGLAIVPWDKVNEVYPGASDVVIDPKTDLIDDSFAHDKELGRAHGGVRVVSTVDQRFDLSNAEDFEFPELAIPPEYKVNI